jgi:hypothetical protein
MLDQILRMAVHVPQPAAVAGGALAAALICIFALRATRPIQVWVFSIVILILGLAPLVSSTLARSRGLYHIRVVVLGPDQKPVDYAQVRSSIGQLQMVEGGWELDLPQRTRPLDNTLTFSAVVNDEFVSGDTDLVLAQDYYPTATIQLVPETSAKVRGVVVDEAMRAVAGATVSIPGYAETAVTDKMGKFVLPAHAGNGQIVKIQAQKGQLTGNLSAPAGKVVEVILGSD